MIARSDDTGSLLPLMSGLVALVMIVVGGLVSLADVQQERRWLYQFADEVVLQSLSALDVESYYRKGTLTSVPLDARAVHALALNAIDQHPDHDVRLIDLQVREDEVLMTFSKTVDLPLGPDRQITVTVAAKAR